MQGHEEITKNHEVHNALFAFSRGELGGSLVIIVIPH